MSATMICIFRAQIIADFRSSVVAPPFFNMFKEDILEKEKVSVEFN